MTPHRHTRAALAAILTAAACLCAGCVLPSESLPFPAALEASADRRAYDTNDNDRPDITLTTNDRGRLDLLSYDDNEDGSPDRVYRLSQYDSDTVPHLIILIDSIPFDAMRERYESDHWTWFDPPQKVIPPFPSMSGVIFSQILGAPPLPGLINRYYDRREGAFENMISSRARGHQNPWERRLHYRLRYWENGLSFLQPRRWFSAELARSKQAFDESPDRITIVYIASSAGMLSRHGEDGLAEVLDGLERLCTQILAERRGAAKITVISDHGHGLIPGERIDLETILRDAGFTVSDHLREGRHAVVEQDGLMTYAGVHTRRPADAARALAADPRVELAIRQEGERIIVRNASGEAVIERSLTSPARYRYTPLDADVLGYAPVLEALAAANKLDSGGFASDKDWFAATLDHRWPDAPHRLWHAFHGLAVNAPDVMVTTRAGYFAGLASMEKWITMASTHGGLDQADSAAFVMTMNGRATRPMRSAEVLPAVEPAYHPAHIRR